jgi:hypothetical protein
MLSCRRTARPDTARHNRRILASHSRRRVAAVSALPASSTRPIIILTTTAADLLVLKRIYSELTQGRQTTLWTSQEIALHRWGSNDIATCQTQSLPSHFGFLGLRISRVSMHAILPCLSF